MRAPTPKDCALRTNNTLPQSLSAVYIHLVFSTKERRPFLRDGDLRKSLHAYLGAVSKELECPPQGSEYRDFQWQGGYADFSVSQSKLAEAIRYIDEQERHQKKVTFQDELRALLRKHDMEWDERYVWD